MIICSLLTGSNALYVYSFIRTPITMILFLTNAPEI